MRIRHFAIALMICWLGAVCLFIAACLLVYWANTDSGQLPLSVKFLASASLLLAIGCGWRFIRSGQLGLLLGLTLFMLGLAAMKFQSS